MVLRTADIAGSSPFKQRFVAEGEVWIHPSDSAVVNPTGEIIDRSVRERDELLYAQIDQRQVSGPR